MLQLNRIKKQYKTGELVQQALDEVSLSFRDNEFVSILGQSGSGKTTLLNIIGGLDRYDDGDLIINGVSTKEYRDSDWDYYRNNSIGFIFQSYNLIPHQTVLANVEMALTLSGVSKKERREKAIEVLKKVGLENHIHKKPNQMSGGQMQRVAVARALINNPDILLADEPTGALDSETSIQIMELLKEIAKDKLVIMVTHNPELAEKYSTRIIRLVDGKIISDSDPFHATDEAQEKKKHKKISMSFLTALSLSFNNLKTKKGRTLLTSFAGAIGIIGIALVMSLSEGINDYIASIQKDTMSSYPISITSEAVDMTGLMGTRMEMVGEMREQADQSNASLSGVYGSYDNVAVSASLLSSIKENNLTSFKKYLDNPASEIHQYVGENGIVFSYKLNFNILTYDASGNLIDCDTDLSESSSFFPGSDFSDMASSMPSSMSSGFSSGLSSITSMLSGTSGSGSANFSELMKGSASAVSPLITDSYEVLYGEWPDAYDEVVLVLDSNNEISASILCQLGYITAEEYQQATEKIENGEEKENVPFNYADMLNHTFYLATASDYYVQNENGTFSYSEDNQAVVSKALPLKVTGVIRPKAEAENATITTAVAYTSMLTDYIISHTDESAVVTAQSASPSVNVLNGIDFEVPNEEQKVADTKEYLQNLSDEEKASVYTMIMFYGTLYGDSEKAESESATESTEMTDAEKAEAFDQWIAAADDELLLTIFNNIMTDADFSRISASESGAESVTVSTENANQFFGIDFLDNLLGKFFKELEAKHADNFFGKIISGIGSFSRSIFGGNISQTVSSAVGGSVINSLTDEEKVALIRKYSAEFTTEEKVKFYTMLSEYNLINADAATISGLSELMNSGSSSLSGFNRDSVAVLLDNWLQNSPDTDTLLYIYDEYIGYSTYEENMESFGKVSYDAPASINIYTDSFDDKDAIAQCIVNYNATADESSQITYTDYISLITSSITTIIDTISYVIIAFVAISLVVSGIMICVITHISVMERTKEIGILRALGASKKNVSHVFNAETIIIGFCSGLLGIGVTLLLLIPINSVIEKLIGFGTLTANLPVSSAVGLIILSVIITFIGGLIPSKKAAKKDPVTALRTE